jgi:arabinogalactan endo-1,4-beta-galactosidase
MKKILAVMLAGAIIVQLLSQGQVSLVTEVSAVNITEVVFPVLAVNDGSPIKGVDISSIVAIEEAGVRFFDGAGNEQDIFQTLKEHGVNYIRARVWNDPTDFQGRTYGGGRNDVEMAGVIGRRAAEHDMKLLVNFHYSDFWADPGKQTPPKAWRHMNILQLETALHDFTRDSLVSIRAAGADIGMVQIGNETNYFMCGLRGMGDLARLMRQGSRAVREFDPEILVAVHFTDPAEMPLGWYASELNRLNVDYDVFMTSYYSFWHGTIANLNNVLSDISRRFGKYVMVAEMAHPYTNAAGDGFGHAVTNMSGGINIRYPFTPQGQVDMMRDVFATLAAITPTHASGRGGGIGAFYWEPAWLGVMGLSHQQRTVLWETHGSGWATRWAGEFDHEADRFGTGGSSYQNQALFDFRGNPLDSLAFFRHVRAVNELTWEEKIAVTTPPVTTAAPPATTTPRVTTPVITTPSGTPMTSPTTIPVTTMPVPTTTQPVTGTPPPITTIPVTTAPPVTTTPPVTTIPVTTAPVTTTPPPVTTIPVTTAPVTTEQPVTTAPVTEKPFLYGDVDQNEAISILDALEILMFLAGMDSVIDAGGDHVRAAIIAQPRDDRTEPNINDVLEILMHLAGMESELDTLNSPGSP